MALSIRSSLAIFATLLLLWSNLVAANENHHRSLNSDYKNLYYKNGGCLSGVSINGKVHDKVRVCNSQDPPEAAEMGFCQPSPYIDYKEVRIAAQTWTTNTMSAWILQIILSELLDVPTSIERGVPGAETNFYHQDATPIGGQKFDYFYGELKTAAEVKDCTLLFQEDEEDYQSCYHVVPEIWWTDRFPGRRDSLPGAEPPRELGALGYQALFATKATVETNPEFASYLGLGGEENRAKLAATFKRPTTWKDYCDQVSRDGCATPDGVAKRAPATEHEKQAYFELDYIGHFRYTDKNNCFANPSTCTGFMADFVCGWASWANQQLHHHKIALESDNPQDPAGGFTTEQYWQILHAAQATNSSLFFYWFDLSPLFFSFLGTDVAPTRITLPEATQSCIENRVDASKRCGKVDGSATMEDLFGDASGACASTTQSLKKVVSTALKEITMDPNTPEALWSPAYDVVDNFEISTHQLGQILQAWVQRRGHHEDFGVVLRQVVCDWVVDNLELLQEFIPVSHPRVIQEEDVAGNELFAAAFGLGCFAAALVTLFFLATLLKRNTKSVYFAQLSFLNLLLLGLGLVAAGAICEVLPPTDVNCVAIAWIVNLGFAIHLVPLLVRISAINNLALTGKQMQRVRLGPCQLYFSVIAVVIAVSLYLVAWMILDRPTEEFQYEVTERMTTDGETIITSFDYCGSSNKWYIISYAWRALIILPAAMIAVVSLRIREDLNDTRTLTIVLFIHAIMLALGILLSWLVDARSDLMAYESILWSVDVILSLLVYIAPKLLRSAEEVDAETRPDVFVRTTIAVTDVVGFSAWSSVREPFQIFKILEEIHGVMDSIADKHGIFKVQTVGELYVAASGIPHPSHDHAVKMAKFARACLERINSLTKELEVTFGPDTSDLQLQIGLHSGSVTGGFVKEKGGRFQLFGDTMTTADVIQRNGRPDQIHLSEATADALIRAGKQNWLHKCDEKIATQAKGEIQTYWLVPKSMERDHHSRFSLNEDRTLSKLTSFDDSKERWIHWNVQTFTGLLKDIVARREKALLWNGEGAGSINFKPSAAMPAEEVVEIIELPKFDKRAAKRGAEADCDEIELPADVIEQLTSYITEVANLYNDNPFHNFAHASYVVMAVVKYMNRIKQANEIDVGDDEDRKRTSAMEAIYNHTFGVASDPLTLFSVVFSALIHDVKHPGVPNPRLIEEDPELAAKYKNRSVAEQRSLDLSWDLLMESRFSKLRSTICRDETELMRFRQLLVNAVMATDLGDKELKELRNSRWDKAFAQGVDSADDPSDTASVFSSSVMSSSIPGRIVEPPTARQDNRNRKATIVIEHLIQASDVAHMSQHWSIYRKWNERLFRECYKAYREGRAENNPADNWYEGDLGFFDFYIIPLSKKLRDCGVFGPTSDENLNYATNNRMQWEREGAAITAQMLKAIEKEYDAAPERKEQAGPLPPHPEEEGSEAGE